jgi:protein SCO1/2
MTESLQARQQKTIRLTVLLLVTVVGLFFGAIVLKFVNEKPDVKAILEENNTLLFSSPRLLPTVALTRHDGTAFTTEQFKGTWNLVNFGYTFCPDICPTNMADMNIAHRQLTEMGLADQVRFWMITVDPTRDTIEQLANYVPYFNDSFIGLTGDAADITTLATQLSAVFYQEGSGETYTVAHSDNYAIIDPNGHFVALMRPPHKPSHISASLQALMAQ